MTAIAAQLAGLITPQVDHRTLVRGMLNALAIDRGFREPWPGIPARLIGQLPVLPDVTSIGAVHEQLLELQAGTGTRAHKRLEQSTYYTPDPVAQFLSRFSLDLPPARDMHPCDVLVMDPACGAGICLVMAARHQTDRLIDLDFDIALGEHGRELLRRDLLGALVADCFFGVDIDEIAVDMTITALWLETDGSHDISWLDDNIIVGDALQGDEPPKLVKRRGRTGAMREQHQQLQLLDEGGAHGD